MRQVTETVARAFRAGDSKTVSNSSTDGEHFWLHGNCIARKLPGGALQITLAGWPTPTTRERINGILQVFNLPHYVFQKDWVTYLTNADGDMEMDAYDWVTIHPGGC